MASVTLGGTPVNTINNLPEVGSPAPAFTLSRNDLSSVTLNDYRGKRLILNIFPSVDTGVCAQSIRTFNERASALENTEVLCISRDLPFAQARFCGAEGIENVSTLSDFKQGEFGKDYGVELVDGGFEGLHSRAIVAVDEKGKVIHTELVSEIGHEPNYDAALKAFS